jgi:hypothetical protein
MKRGIPFLLGLLAFSACRGKVTEQGGTGGTTGVGGAGGTRGTRGTVGTGGGIGTGGVVGTGGILGTGGAIGTGGVAGTGGILGTGGAIGAGGAGGSGGATGAGGAVGTGGRIGTGGVVGTGGAFATGGAFGTGGKAGSGGISGTGGNSQPCIPACTAGQDCVSGTCLLHLGSTCSIAADCASSARCCDSADQTCDGTRLPAGDGTNSGQFVVSPDGLTVTDTITGLVWQRDGSGTREGCDLDGFCSWAAAKAYCAALDGASGWRLPSRMELLTIVDFTRLPVDLTSFPDTPGNNFWTSSPRAGSSSEAWYVDFLFGQSGYFDVHNGGRVRCVR